MDLLKRSIAELVGTMLLVFIGCGSVSVLLMLAADTPTVSAFDIGIGTLGGLGDWLAVGVAFGLAVAVVIYALGGVSGAHINPAVSIALWSIKKFPAKDTVAYIIAQCIGGLGATAPFPGISLWQALVAEIIGTFVLMLAIMGVAVDRHATPGFAGLVIGMAVTGVIIAIGNISGGSINPARSFGPDLIATIMNGSTALVTTYPIYIVGPIVGAVLAAFFYKYIVGIDDN